MSASTQDALILILIFAIVTLGLDVVVGYTRILAINQALLFGVGAFGFGFVVNHLHTESLLVAWAITIPAAALLGALVAIVSLRVKGDYFIVVSFGVQVVGIQALYNWNTVSGGPSGVLGLPYPSIFGWSPISLGDYLLLSLGVAAVCYAGVALLLLAPYGRLLRALGQDEPALEAAGFSPMRLKVSAFVLGGALAAVAGCLYSGYEGIAQTTDFSLNLSIFLVAMVVVGGAGRIVGGLFGAALYVLVPHFLNESGLSSSNVGAIEQIVFGGLLLLVVMTLPTGISGGLSAGWRRFAQVRRPAASQPTVHQQSAADRD
jgi:branched-chain amino acid transport system permease protein